MLPYMEQEAVGRLVTDAIQRNARACCETASPFSLESIYPEINLVNIPSFRCPSDGETIDTGLTAYTNYAGCAGSNKGWVAPAIRTA